MRPTPPGITVDSLISALLSACGPDRALDALVYLLTTAGAGDGGLCPVEAARHALVDRPPCFTSQAAATVGCGRTLGLIVATGRNAVGRWASVWLPPPCGDAPLIMFGPDEPRAAAAALAEALRFKAASGTPRNLRPVRRIPSSS